MRVEIIKDPVRWGEIAGDWESLEATSGSELPFMAWHYLDAAWQVFCTQEAKKPRHPFILTAWDEGDQLVGALPLAGGFPRSGSRKWVRHLGFLGTIVGTMAEEHGLLASPDNGLRLAAGMGRKLPHYVKYSYLAFAGDEIYLEGNLNCRFVDGRPVATRGIFRDISERKVVDRMKNEFISTVSHELRTPLTSIIASLGLLQSGRLNDNAERVKELVTVAHRNSNRLLCPIARTGSGGYPGSGRGML